MSQYTTELRYVVENFDIGLRDYPIFDEAYRAILNQKIIDHYYFREIGFETVALFRFMLNRTMREIMPYYNQLYESERLTIEPLVTNSQVESYQRDINQGDTTNQNVVGKTDITENGSVKDDLLTSNTASGTANTATTSHNTDDDNDKRTIRGNSTGSTKDTGTNLTHNTYQRQNVSSDTPQGLLSMPNIEGQIYATNADIINDTAMTELTIDTTQSRTDANDSTDTYTHSRISDGTGSSDTTTSDRENGTANRTSTTTDTQTQNLTNAIDTTATMRRGESYSSNVKGTNANQSDLLMKYRETFLNIDMMVIEELNDLFMLVY